MFNMAMRCTNCSVMGRHRLGLGQVWIAHTGVSASQEHLVPSPGYPPVRQPLVLKGEMARHRWREVCYRGTCDAPCVQEKLQSPTKVHRLKSFMHPRTNFAVSADRWYGCFAKRNYLSVFPQHFMFYTGNQTTRTDLKGQANFYWLCAEEILPHGNWKRSVDPVWLQIHHRSYSQTGGPKQLPEDSSTVKQTDDHIITNRESEGPSRSGEGKSNKTQQLKRVFKEYGAVGVSFHVGISLISLGIFYMAVSSGLDMTAILFKLGFSEAVVQSKMAAGTSTFVLAYAIHKMFAPVRISITVVSVPLLVRYFRKVGFFKPPAPNP
ncbi:protein FAM210B, mitochondrial [Protopterus annectens]|uniref:protein FAM210B, mitochondrial n=1 Tax=Protopterus annectens TaxID=7888 RepID=UPI001CFAF02D|nr:protein FAM210B, mitochondrial [Protopterus annectens]